MENEAAHYNSDVLHGLSRSPGVTERLFGVLALKYPTTDRPIVRRIVRMGTVIRRRHINQRNQQATLARGQQQKRQQFAK